MSTLGLGAAIQDFPWNIKSYESARPALGEPASPWSRGGIRFDLAGARLHEEGRRQKLDIDSRQGGEYP